MATQQEEALATTVEQPTAASESAPTPEPTAPSRPRRFSLRGFTSLLLSLAFLSMCVSGAMLFLTPRGRTANWTDWTLVGLDKHEWGSVHVNNSVIFVLIAVLHLLLNWNVFMRYIKKKTSTGLNMKKELALASALAAVCVVGPIWGVPPFSSLMAVNEDIKNYWDENSQQAPVPHAEDLTLSEFADTIELSVDDVTKALEEAGYPTTGADQSLGEIAEQSDVAPSALFAAIRERHPNTRGWGRINGRGAGGNGAGKKGCGPEGEDGSGKQAGDEDHGPGWGRGRGQGWAAADASDSTEFTVEQVAQAVGLETEEVLFALFEAGYGPESGKVTLGQLANDKGGTPEDVIHAIRDQFPDTRGWGRVGGTGGGGH